jgi:octaprenyl-diphosphate synthase
LEAGAPLTWVHTPAQAFALVGSELQQAEARLKELVGSEVAVVTAIGAYLAAAGGKRLRPLLTALGAGAVGHEASPDLLCVGEMIHLGSLLHDDVVDEAAERRGRPAAHRVFGNAGVILTGDFSLARAVLLASTAGGHLAVTRLAEAVTAMAEGEVLQLRRAGDLGTTRAEYLETIDKKSAALISWCAAAGAYSGCRPGDPSADVLARYGREVGVAFQITDDVLDYQPGTGKPVGQDLREKKLTLPLLLAMDRVPGLRARVERGDDVHGLCDAVRSCGALDDALGEARQRVDHAIRLLSALPASPSVDALAVLGRHLVERAT